MDMFLAYKTTKGLNIVEVGDEFEKYTENVTQLVVCDLNGNIQKYKMNYQIYLKIKSVYSKILNILWI